VGTLSIWHILILMTVAVLVFGGRGKISDLMGDVAKGIRSFRTGLAEPESDHVGVPQLDKVAAIEKSRTTES
jgi:sec-independent protein translocase protein TatA